MAPGEGLATAVTEGMRLCHEERGRREPPVPVGSCCSVGMAAQDGDSTHERVRGHLQLLRARPPSVLGLLPGDGDGDGDGGGSCTLCACGETGGGGGGVSGLCAVVKPAGLPVHAAGAYARNTLLAVLAYEQGEHQLRPLHRLDRLTSGGSKRLVVESPWSQFESECQRF
eukprot:COSAG01_NODE_585_length_15160_cov_15.779473_6_plen_170_part_00